MTVLVALVFRSEQKKSPRNSIILYFARVPKYSILFSLLIDYSDIYIIYTNSSSTLPSSSTVLQETCKSYHFTYWWEMGTNLFIELLKTKKKTSCISKHLANFLRLCKYRCHLTLCNYTLNNWLGCLSFRCNSFET